MNEEERQIQGTLEQDYEKSAQYAQDVLILKTEEVLEKIRKRGWHIADIEQGIECSGLLVEWLRRLKE